MATFNKFNPFVENVHHGKFNFSSDDTCTITVALSASEPSAAWGQLSQVSQISYANLSSRVVSVASSGQTDGVYSLVLTDLELSASGDVAAFRYIILYDDDSTGDLLICWYDRGESVTLHNLEKITLDFDDLDGLFQVSTPA